MQTFIGVVLLCGGVYGFFFYKRPFGKIKGSTANAETITSGHIHTSDDGYRYGFTTIQNAASSGHIYASDND